MNSEASTDSTTTSTKFLTLIRHGQALHNATGNHNLLDPCLTPLGISQCQRLDHILNNSTIPQPSQPPPIPSPPTLLVSSPLTRALQTTLISFRTFLKTYQDFKIIPLALLQETADLPCDTGRNITLLKQDFGGKGTLRGIELGLVDNIEEEILLKNKNFTTVTEGEEGEGEGEGTKGTKGVNDKIQWEQLDPLFPKKEGIYTAKWEILCERARLARKWLWEKLHNNDNNDNEQQHIIGVLHGGFLHYLTEHWTHKNPPHQHTASSGWLNTEFRTFQFVSIPEGQDMDKWSYSIIETEESKKRRKLEGTQEKPLTKTEELEYKRTHPSNVSPDHHEKKEELELRRN